MRLIKAKNGFIIDMQDKAELPIICNNRIELHDRIDEIFSVEVEE